MTAGRPRFAGFLSLLASCLPWLIIVAGTADAASRNVEAWVSGELAEYVLVQLTTIPRFAAAPVHLVVFADGQPAPRTNALSLALRDTLRRSLAGRSGVRLGWQPDPALPLPSVPTTAEQCEAMRPELLVGIEVRSGGGDAASVSLRARDETEQRWVPGFGREWQGELTAAQRRAFASPATDRSYLGQRDVPYGPSETDLIANHLARDLRCQLMRQVSGDYRLAAVDAPADGDALSAVPSLVRHQVGGVSSLRLLSSADAANAELSGQLHPVAGGLNQYWLVLDPVGSADGLQPLASSVYVELPVEAPATTLADVGLRNTRSDCRRSQRHAAGAAGRRPGLPSRRIDVVPPCPDPGQRTMCGAPSHRRQRRNRLRPQSPAQPGARAPRRRALRTATPRVRPAQGAVDDDSSPRPRPGRRRTVGCRRELVHGTRGRRLLRDSIE